MVSTPSPWDSLPTNAIHRGVARAYFQHCLQALSTSLLSLTTNRVNGNALPQTAHGTSVSLYRIDL